MATTYKKTITAPGVYLGRTIDGKRKLQVVTKQKLKNAAKTANAMIEAGLLIPGPYGHTDSEGIHPIPLVRSMDGELLDAKTKGQTSWDKAINSGFWNRFDFNESTGELEGYEEVEGDPEDQNTHAGRVGKTYKQVSPIIVDEWTDGDGRVWKDAILHVAVTNKAVQSNQKPFERVDPLHPELAIAMSLCTDDLVGGSSLSRAFLMDIEAKLAEDSGSTTAPSDSNVFPSVGPEVISKIRAELKTKLKVTLPEDTDPSNFHDRLLTILTNLEPEEETETDFNKKPEGSETIASPTIMSQVTDPNAAPLEKKLAGLLQNALSTRQLSCKTRINTLVSKGQIGRKYADEKLLPLANALVMSLEDITEDGSIPPTALEMSLDVLEQNETLIDDPTKSDKTARPADSTSPDGASDMGDPNMDEVDDETVDEVLSGIFPRSIYPVINN